MEDTRELIKIKFAELYLQRGLRNLSVKKLCEQIPIARSTFYAYYYDQYGVLEDIVDELVAGIEIINRDFKDCDFRAYNRGEGIEPHKYVVDTLAFIKEKHIYFHALLKHSDNYLVYRWKQLIFLHFGEKYQAENIPIKHLDLVLEIIASSIIGGYTYWVNNINTISAEDLFDAIFTRCFQDFIFLR